jgi:molybdopterin-binding protein
MKRRRLSGDQTPRRDRGFFGALIAPEPLRATTLGLGVKWTAERTINERRGGMLMQIGARNRIEGEVTEIKLGTVMCQVRVRIAGGAEMESVMTIDSLTEMGLKVGDKVRVAVKAVNVLLIKD